MKVKEFMKKFGKYADVFSIVEEPQNSLDKLKELKECGQEGTIEYKYWLSRYFRYK